MMWAPVDGLKAASFTPGSGAGEHPRTAPSSGRPPPAAATKSDEASGAIDQSTDRPVALRILLAEDDTALRELLAESLRADGHDVVEAIDGGELIRAARSVEAVQFYTRHEPFDLVITDVRMPGVTGFDVLRYLAAAECPAPVIVITAFGDPDTHARALALGAAAVLDKPFDFEALRSVVLQVLPMTLAR